MPATTTSKPGRVKRVADGVFFTVPETLPRGRHKLSPEQVSDAQSERMLAAVTELLAARGYRGFGVGEIATRAGVSLEAFYKCFAGKDACIFAGYDRFIDVLLRRIAAVDARPMTAQRAPRPCLMPISARCNRTLSSRGPIRSRSTRSGRRRARVGGSRSISSRTSSGRTRRRDPRTASRPCHGAPTSASFAPPGSLPRTRSTQRRCRISPRSARTSRSGSPIRFPMQR